MSMHDGRRNGSEEGDEENSDGRRRFGAASLPRRHPLRQTSRIPGRWRFQEAATPIMEQIDWFEAYTLWFIIPITLLVLALLIYCIGSSARV